MTTNTSRDTPSHRAEIGIFGGSGFYEFLSDPVRRLVNTPYGPPSSPAHLGTLSGRRVAFIPRHGERHQFPSHTVNYAANVWAMKELGVDALISPCAAGSLTPEIAPGSFVVLDQLVDRTKGRRDTFFDGPIATHISLAEPYCPVLRKTAVETARGLGIDVHDGGTVVVIEGPRFSTVAESRWYASAGFQVINMTQYPEAALAREAQLCFLGIALITDYDCGVEGVRAASGEEIVKVFNENNEKLRSLLIELVKTLPPAEQRDCACREALRGAQINTGDF
jgi:5'-methylthioadenosine phosphorylase